MMEVIQGNDANRWHKRYRIASPKEFMVVTYALPFLGAFN